MLSLVLAPALASAEQGGGEAAMQGEQRIGWDPAAKKIKSWVFHSDGGFAEGYWTRQDNRWIIRSSGTARDGLLGLLPELFGPSRDAHAHLRRAFRVQGEHDGFQGQPAVHRTGRLLPHQRADRRPGRADWIG